MTRFNRKHLLVFGVAAAAWMGTGAIDSTAGGGFVATANAVVGAPATPVSYAGVTRRSTVGDSCAPCETQCSTRSNATRSASSLPEATGL